MRPLLVCLAGLLPAADPGFVSLFDGTTLNGWTLVGQKGPGYVVREGMLVCPADGGGNLFSDKEYSNFILRFEYRLEAGGNNGLAVRAPKKLGSIAHEGTEIQILDHENAKWKKRKQPLKPVQYNGSVYDVIAPKAEALKPSGEWNTQEVTVNGRRIRVVLNGVEIQDADLDSVTDPAVLKKHPGLQRTRGHIGWLGHGSLIEFRNIRIRELP